ncbi:MAG TPA: serine hydrolase, partial [Clostridia bacterium]|nr:serine hydrolase [Clostridia bacterium]
YRTNIYSVDAKGTGAGGAFTTAGDVERFWDALLSEKLLAAETVKDMLARHSGNGEDHYGYGIWLRPEGEAEYSPFFQGSDPGVSFISQHRLCDGLSITLMSNYGDNVWELLEVLRAAFPQAHKERL